MYMLVCVWLSIRLVQLPYFVCKYDAFNDLLDDDVDVDDDEDNNDDDDDDDDDDNNVDL